MAIKRSRKPGSSKEDKSYVYTYDTGGVVDDEDTLSEIKKMAIPPAYVKVRVYPGASAKIRYEGYDEKGRLQQKYSEAHNDRAKKAKFCRLIEFGRAFPKIQSDINKYMSTTRMTKNKIISTILQIIWKCGFRVGNVKYQHLYESHGISNIFKKHVSVDGKRVTIEFKGKKGVVNTCIITEQGLVKELIRLTKDIDPGDYVFTYKAGNKRVHIRSADINEWLSQYGKISSKDLRTFDVNVMFIDYIRKEGGIKGAKTVISKKKIAKSAIAITAAHINNTPAICKSSYLMPEVYSMLVNHPRKYKKYFLGSTNSRVAFINFLKVHCA